MVLTVSFALSQVIGLVCHLHRRNFFHRLDASVEASGPHDFAVRKNKRSRQQRHPRPSRPRPTFVTIAKRPFVSGRDASVVEVIWVKSEPEYFCEGDWTGSISLIRLNKSS
jgi:hypothetical protein